MNKQGTTQINRLSIWQALWQKPLSRMALIILFVLYGGAIFAEILAPYSFKEEFRSFSYAPPTQIEFIHGGRLAWPFVRGQEVSYDEFHARVYRANEEVYPLTFFGKGESYKMWGMFEFDRHFFGVDSPGQVFLFGADGRGRDIFSRLLYGARVSLSVGLIGVLISFSLGLLIGGIAGYFGGWVDDFLMRLCEMIMMVPGFYLLLALRSAVPDEFNSVQVYFMIVIILSFIGWAGLARIIRGMCLSLKSRDYVSVAQSLGVGHVKIIVKHILPHTISYSMAAVMLSIPGYILGESALSLIGLGIQDPHASWGNMLGDAMSIVRITFAPWILWPAFFIFLSVMAFNVLGDVLRDILDPMMKREGVKP